MKDRRFCSTDTFGLRAMSLRVEMGRFNGCDAGMKITGDDACALRCYLLLLCRAISPKGPCRWLFWRLQAVFMGKGGGACLLSIWRMVKSVHIKVKTLCEYCEIVMYL